MSRLTAVVGLSPRAHRVGELAVYVDSSDALTRVGIERALSPFTDMAQVSSPASASVIIVAMSEVDQRTVRRMTSLKAAGSGRIVLVVDQIDESGLLAAVEVGVSGVLPRDQVDGDSLAAAIRAAAGGDGTLSPDLLGSLLQAVGRLSRDVLSPRGLTLAPLSEREVKVLRLVADGHDTQEIARRLCYSPRTIKNIIHDVMRRQNLRNRTHAVAFALRNNLI